MIMSKNHKQQSKKNDYFVQQKVFGDWNNLLEPPITFAELLSKVIVTPQAPDGFLKELTDYHLLAEVRVKNQ